MAAVTQDITAEQGAALAVTLTGAGASLNGRSLRMHVRSKVGVTTTKLVASTTDGRLAVGANPYTTATLAIDADVMAAVSITLPTEYWVYDVESYTTAADVRREWSGRFTISRDVTRDTEATTEAALSGAVLYSGPQSLTTAQKLQARENIGAGTGGGSSAWGGITGTLTDQTDLVTALGLKAPLASPTLTGTPAAPTAAGGNSTTQIATTAFVGGEITTHAGATDPHGDRSFATSAVSTHSGLTTGVHGITAAGAALLDDATAADQRTTLGLGTAATTAATAYEASGAIATHSAVTTAHGISAFGATLVDDADAATARTTLGLGTAATSASGDFATAGHNHSGVYQPADAELTAIAGLTSAADSAPYFTGSGTAALMTVTAAGRAILDDADATAQRATLGLAIGTNVQAYDADLTTWAGITPGTGVATALGTNVGSAGAVVTNGGALGTPSSGTLTNVTGLPPAGITQSGATSNQVLTWNGSAWAPATPSAGLSEPLTTTRFTRQSSALTAAASGETKLQFRDLVRSAFAAVRATNDANELLFLPDYTHPGLTGWHWNVTAFAQKNIAAMTQGGYTAGTTIMNTIGAGNFATAASSNAVSNVYTGAWLRDGSANGDGYIQWGLVDFPDASYGSGATGVKINLGAWAASATPLNGNRPSGRCATLEFNTNQSDTNWQLCVYDTTLETVDTGLAFTAQKSYFWMIHLPRGGTAVYAYIKEIGGSSGSAVSTKTPGSTAMFSIAQMVTLTSTARNYRLACQWNYIPLEL